MLTPEESKRLLEFFGISDDYVEVTPQIAATHQCAQCGAKISALADAVAVICDGCGRKIDIAGGAAPCGGCGAPLSFPLGVSHVSCPYCHAETERV